MMVRAKIMEIGKMVMVTATWMTLGHAGMKELKGKG